MLVVEFNDQNLKKKEPNDEEKLFNPQEIVRTKKEEEEK